MSSPLLRVPVLRKAALLATALLAACGTTVDTTYAGEPLLVLTGRASISANDRPAGAVRLSLAWYPSFGRDEASAPSAPVGILTQDVQFQSTFADVRLPVFQPPPPEAIVDLGGEGQGLRGAFGLLLAYEDLNGNGRLDTTPAEGPAVDRVVGSSFLDAWYVVYMESTPPPETGVKRGFNLVHVFADPSSPTGVTEAVLPLDTPIPIALSAGDDPALQAAVCEVLWEGWDDVEPPCGIELGPEEPGEPLPPPDSLQASGRIARAGSDVEVELAVWRMRAERTDAVVTLAGRSIPYEQFRGRYVLRETDSTLLAGLGSVELVVSAGGETLRKQLTFPGDATVLEPAPDAQVRIGEELVVRWTPVTGAYGYALNVSTPESPYLMFMEVYGDTSATLSSPLDPAYTGPATLTVSAIARTPNAEGLGALEVLSGRTVPLTFVP